MMGAAIFLTSGNQSIPHAVTIRDVTKKTFFSSFFSENLRRPFVKIVKGVGAVRCIIFWSLKERRRRKKRPRD